MHTPTRPRVSVAPGTLRVFLVAAVLGILACIGGNAAADEKLPSAQELEQRIQALEADKELEEAPRAAAIEALRESLRGLGELQAHVRRESEFEARRASAPAELTRLQDELAQPPTVELPNGSGGIATADIDKALQEARAEEAERAKAVEALRGGPAAREARLKQLPTALAEARRLATEAERAVAEPAPASDPAPLTAARRTRARIRLESARANVAALEAEQRALEAEAGLYAARLKVAERAKEKAQQITRAWQALWQARREAEDRKAEAAAERAAREAENADPLVKDLAERNLELTRSTREVTDRTKQATLARQTAQDELDTIDRRETDVRKRIAAVGLTEAIGYLLRQHRTRLPNAGARGEALAARKGQIADLQLQRFEYEEEIERLRQGITKPNAEGARLARLEALRADRVEYLDAALTAIDKCVAALVELDTTERQLLARAAAYGAFIDERVLWIRSTEPLWNRGLRGTGSALAWLASPQEWSGTLGAVGRQTRRAPLKHALLLLAYVVLFVAGARLARAAQTPPALATKATRFGPTLLRFAGDLLCALRIPAALWLGGTLLADGGSTPLQRAVGFGLLDTAAFTLPLLALRRILAPGGLARAHFGWSAASTSRIRGALPLVLGAGAPAAFLVAVFERAPNEDWNAGLGRLALVALLVVSAAFLERVLRPSAGVLTPGDERSTTWLQRTRGLWYLLGVGVPVVLAALALFGYQFTATELTDRLEQTVALVAGLVVLQALVSRSLVVAHRRAEPTEPVPASAPPEGGVATADAVGVAAPTPASGGGEEAPLPSPPPEEAHLDAETVDAHTRQLLRTLSVLAALLGAWFIWVDVLPALGMLRGVELWTTSEQVTRTVVVDGVSTPTAVLEIVPVTLADVLAVLVMLTFTVLAARNIPGVLELVLLKRLVVQPSSRYAIATVARHLIWIVGLALILGRLGLGWSKIQWLVAALGVGLGFGLQEIFGNFISGLILLFERRIRLGDIVTIGDVSGQVTRIRVLATTVRSWERKEFVVPNKDLITGRLLNWTLSDDVNRLVVHAGVAYGTDTRRARELMVKVAQRHPEVVSDPAPFATFEQFGDNSLLLTMRAFITDLTRRWVISTDLHEGVAKAFAKAGIEIAFPQRDLYLKHVPPGWPAAGEGGGASESPT